MNKTSKKDCKELPSEIAAAKTRPVDEEILEGIGKVHTKIADVKKEHIYKPK